MVRFVILLAAMAATWWFFARQRRERSRDAVARARADFLAAPEPEPLDTRGMKEIVYRGGLVWLLLPEAWREEHGPEGGATFSDPASSDRALRLNTITAEKRGAGPEELAFLLGSLRPAGECTLTSLPDGQLLLKHVDAGREAGADVVLYTWQLARSVSGGRARIAVFTLAVAAEQASSALTNDDRRRVERIVRAARIAED
ncbi:MAG TPA: hypothetical protein VFQ51_18890 [Vicinamibacteria bacterium]|nr:hypothetical protein [Vicinamibacteria bacterium]